jgi:hypothetical protein
MAASHEHSRGAGACDEIGIAGSASLSAGRKPTADGTHPTATPQDPHSTSRTGGFSMDTTTPETMSQPMDTQTERLDGFDDENWVDSPVDDATYDVMMALASKLEGIDTYHVYAQDGNVELWRQIAEDDRRHADLLLAELKSRLAGS